MNKKIVLAGILNFRMYYDKVHDLYKNSILVIIVLTDKFGVENFLSKLASNIYFVAGRTS